MCAMPGGSKDLKADSSTVVWGYFYQVSTGGRSLGGVQARQRQQLGDRQGWQTGCCAPRRPARY